MKIYLYSELSKYSDENIAFCFLIFNLIIFLIFAPAPPPCAATTPTRHHAPLLACAAANEVVAVAPLDAVTAGPACYQVVTAATVYLVFARPARQGVVAALAVNFVVATASADHIRKVGFGDAAGQGAVWLPTGGAPLVGAVQGVAGQYVQVDFGANQLGPLVPGVGLAGFTGVFQVERDGVALYRLGV